MNINPFKTIRYGKFVLLLVLFSLVLQLIIISYNHYSGFFTLTGMLDFITRWVYSSVLTFIAANILVWPNLKVIQLLNRYYGWQKHIGIRIAYELAGVVLIAVIIAIFITMLAHTIDNYEEPLNSVLVTNVLVTSVVNLIFMIALEAWLFFSHGRREEQRVQELNRELSLMRFEVLKDQLKPHFMFNSLNVLSGLIDENVEKAQDFIDEFAQVYRYVLETIEKNLVTVDEELNFARSYMYLQQVRYGENLHFTIDVSASYLTMCLPPLSMQIVLENAIKHNALEPGKPLKISVYSTNETIVIENNLQPKGWKARSTGLGQDNLTKRYELVGAQAPEFLITEKKYTVKLPAVQIND
ncbi:MAG: histidine kinase [Salinivirgaceae bacterium]